MESKLEDNQQEPEETRLLNNSKKECASIVNAASQDYPKVSFHSILICKKKD